jgi:hypothetical protein
MFGYWQKRIRKTTNMNREEFIRRAIRYLLFGLLAIVGILTGSKAATGTKCTSCPGKGVCSGESDCSTFLSH